MDKPTAAITTSLGRKVRTKPTATRGKVTGAVAKANAVDFGRFFQYRGFLLLVFAALALWLNYTFLVPVVMGAIFAIVLYPLMNKMKGWRAGRAWKAAIVTVGFTISFMLPLGGVIIAGAEKGLVKIQHLQSLDLGSGNFSPARLIDALGLRPMVKYVADVSPVTEAQVRQFGTRAVVSIGTVLGKGLQNFLAGLPTVIFGTLIILFTLFFLLIDGPRAANFIRQNSIFGTEQTNRIFDSVHSLCYSVLVATVMSGAVQAAIIGLACLITGTEGLLLIVLISFFASFFPLVGTAPVTIFLTAQAFLSGDTTAGIIFLIAIPIVGFSDNFVRPYVLKGGAELHPLLGFVSAFGALDVIGFYGLFIGPVVTGLFFTLLPMITRSYPRPKQFET